MTSTTKARHRKATRPLTPLSDVAPPARLGLAVAASSGLALAMVGSGAAVAASTATEVGDSAGSLQAGVGALAAPVREALTVNEAVTVASDAQWQGVAAVEVAAEPAPAPKVEEPKVEETPEAADEAEAQEAPASRSQEARSESSHQQPQQQAPAQEDRGPAPASAAGSQIVALAWQYVGVPYVYGGSSPAGFDCSGLVQYVYRQAGISLPRTSWAQGGSGRHVSAAEAQPGDIVYYGHHVGIYVGNGQMIHAPKPGDHVRLADVYGSPSYVRVG